jgi:type I site-specific restriction endonuclease
MTPEQKARVSIDALLVAAGWHVCSAHDANIHASTGVAIREFPLNTGFEFADYLLYLNGKACGVIEAKEEGATFTGVEVQSGSYAQGLTGGGRQNLNAPTIAAIPFGLPPLAEQGRIVAEVDRHLPIIREVEDEVETNLKRAQALRHGAVSKQFRM